MGLFYITLGINLLRRVVGHSSHHSLPISQSKSLIRDKLNVSGLFDNVWKGMSAISLKVSYLLKPCLIFVYFFVCFRPRRELFIIWKPHFLYRWRAADIYLALTAIKLWGFFNVPHLLWHGASVYNGHLRGPVTLITVTGYRKCGIRAVYTCINDLKWRLATGIQKPNLPHTN